MTPKLWFIDLLQSLGHVRSRFWRRMCEDVQRFHAKSVVRVRRVIFVSPTLKI